jgi:hypothetical protein
VTEIGQVPLALCSIIAKAEEANQPEIATIADSILNLILGEGTLSILELPPVAQEEIAAIVARHAAA